jgi:hypothetical protein
LNALFKTTRFATIAIFRIYYAIIAEKTLVKFVSKNTSFEKTLFVSRIIKEGINDYNKKNRPLLTLNLSTLHPSHVEMP